MINHKNEELSEHCGSHLHSSGAERGAQERHVVDLVHRDLCGVRLVMTAHSIISANSKTVGYHTWSKCGTTTLIYTTCVCRRRWRQQTARGASIDAAHQHVAGEVRLLAANGAATAAAAQCRVQVRAVHGPAFRRQASQLGTILQESYGAAAWPRERPAVVA